MSINNVNISGNLTRNSELKQTAGGVSILSFGIAVTDRQKNSKTNEWIDYTNFFECILFGARADKLSQYLVKGFKVTLSGKLHYSSWESEGEKKSKVEIIVDNIDFMAKPKEQQNTQPQIKTEQQTIMDDDIPF